MIIPSTSIKAALFALLLGITIGTGYGQTAKKYSKEVEEKITQVEQNLKAVRNLEGQPSKWTLEDRMKHHRINGVSIAVIKDYKVEWARGYGMADAEEKRPVTVNTLFQAGSISKSLNGVGVLKLAQDKKLSLDADINEYLKSWKFPYDSLAKGKKITLANLLSHTAGLTVHGFPGYEVGAAIPTLPQVLNGEKPTNTAAVRSKYAPSLKYEYSGGGTTISQLLVQDVTGQPYDKFMYDNVLKPMGMKASSYTQPPTAAQQPLLASGYQSDGKPVKGKYHLYPEQAAAGLWTTPTDLAIYIIETQRALQGKSAKVLSQDMNKRRLTPYVDSLAGFGVFIMNKRGVQYFHHSGADEGFVSNYVGSMDGGNGVVVMTNTQNSALLGEIINSVATTYNWKNYYAPVNLKQVLQPNTVLAPYVGKYKVQNQEWAIELKNDGPWLAVNPTTAWKMYFTDPTHFFVLEQSAKFSMMLDGAGKVNAIAVNDKPVATRVN
ncbi:serine hydrolase domain-containing protein [Hymenobacter arizonensis]|uniref:CubicO group peptidase, beta-lactamase class C family n=1 Tax=Hymenobacter arizonensis TaxID=1227077 RepID=A0A1I5ZP17_HYMAR|nr:serine hydrolase domain-containing protein [Hymenobacter arizonensis]SFQ58201.1 CubicO group peptidase, beta-lactamase class C family [Hymenobacter arizonensis]